MEINFYYVQNEYIEYLKRAEIAAREFTCVPNMQYHSRNKFVFGACFQNNGINYFVPVSHQIKHGDNNIIIKTKPKKGKSLELGSLRFAYMIPVPKQCLIMLDIKKIPEYDQKRRINDELAFCRREIDKIKKQAEKTFEAITSSKSKKLLSNSCDFIVLQNAYISYCQEHLIELPKVLQEQEFTITIDKKTKEQQDCSEFDNSQADGANEKKKSSPFYPMSRAKRQERQAKRKPAEHPDKAAKDKSKKKSNPDIE